MSYQIFYVIFQVDVISVHAQNSFALLQAVAELVKGPPFQLQVILGYQVAFPIKKYCKKRTFQAGKLTLEAAKEC